MVVIRLANGNLLVPDSASTADGRMHGDAYVEIDSSDAEFAQFDAQAISQEEYDARRRAWREGDEQLRQEFLDYVARHGASGGWRGPDPDDGS